MFRAWDPHPCHFAVTNIESGEAVFDTKLAGFHREERMPKDEGWRNPCTTFRHGVYSPHTQSPPLKKTKPYKVVCRRHPWQVGYVFVVDSPYVVVSRGGPFHIDGVPTGTWTVEARHPELGPVQRTQ